MAASRAANDGPKCVCVATASAVSTLNIQDVWPMLGGTDSAMSHLYSATDTPARSHSATESGNNGTTGAVNVCGSLTRSPNTGGVRRQVFCDSFKHGCTLTASR